MLVLCTETAQSLDDSKKYVSLSQKHQNPINLAKKLQRTWRSSTYPMDRSGQTELEVRLEETGDNLESQKSVSLASKEKENSTDIPQKNDLLEELKRVNGSIFVLVEYLKMATAYKKSRIRKVSRGCGLDPILAADIADVIVTITELETITMLNAMLYIGQIMKNTKNSGG